MECKICNKIFKGIHGLAGHIKQAHKETTVEKYYINFINIVSSLCEVQGCGKKKKFYGLKYGYRPACSPSCGAKRLKPQYFFGKIFANLKVLNKYEYRKNRLYLFCECSKCNNTKYISSLSLLKNKSCGCSGSNRIEKNRSAFNRVMDIYLNNARSRNLNFSLTEEECRQLFAGNCHYCNAGPSKVKKSSGNGEFIYNGIDRVNNLLGYSKNNCVSCCFLCNVMKLNLEYETFVSQIIKIYNNLKTSSNMKAGELVEKLQIANQKLFQLCDRKDDAAKNPDKYTKEDLISMATKDIELCKERAAIKSEINKIIHGEKSYEEVKNYGN